ncbi:cation:proton antiporter [Rhizobium calliandrae]|uniref:Cation:proton antiporter n=1 Tax=Rhizobium calliandrae TaxID=1312182 RepID=A0ABT7KJ89_9HYPH|nr:cation:proton antiporter [Rhizobium calliandrae]MDL2408622.1 cation:proton antiporter [Rhizobium calliandrae]
MKFKCLLKSLRPCLLAMLAACIFFPCSATFAAESTKAGGASEGLFLIQIIVLVVVGRLLGELMVRIGQPSIMGQILGGVLLGPSILGTVLPDLQQQLFPPTGAQNGMTEAVAQLGILFLLLLAGMETDLGLAKRLKSAALAVSLTGIAIPFACGFALGELVPDSVLPYPEKRLVTSLFLGTALSISSVKIVASVVREMDFMRRNIGQLIVASAIIDDTVGWVVIAVTFSLAERGTVDLKTLTTSVVGTFAFMTFSFTIGRRLVFEAIRLTNDKFRSDLPVLSAIIAIMGGMAIITDLIGVHTVLGAFVAGILVGESPILTRQIDGQLRALTTALFMPVFFGLTGLKTDLGVLGNPATLMLAIGLIVIASVGKFGGAFVGAKLGGYSNAEAVALGSGMNARGSTEVIVASIGLSVGVLDEKLFSIIVAMAVVTTMAMPPTLRWALSRLPMRADERERLEQEQFKENSFLANFERIMLAVDLTPSSDLAARIAGHFAAERKMPVTVLNIEPDASDQQRRQTGPLETTAVDAGAKAVADRVTSIADEAINREGETGQTTRSDIHVTTKLKDSDLAKVLAEGSEQGHDLLFIGVEPVSGAKGGFDDRLSLMTSAFKGTAVIVSSRGRSIPQEDKNTRILVPISGTQRSIKAAEFAFLIAKVTGCSISVLYIEEAMQARMHPRLSDNRYGHLEAFERIDQIARFNGVAVEKIVQEGSSPELSILRQSRKGGYDLIVLGVSRRAAPRLSYGRIPDTLVEAADRSFILVETE